MAEQVVNERERNVVVYYLGYPGVTTQVVTLVGNQPYGSPMKDGKPDIGGVLEIRQADLHLFMSKNRYYDKDEEKMKTAYTLDSQLAAMVKTSGKVGAAATTDVGSILGMLTEEQLQEQLAIRAQQLAASQPKGGKPAKPEKENS